jgi:hypothetical protein
MSRRVEINPKAVRQKIMVPRYPELRMTVLARVSIFLERLRKTEKYLNEDNSYTTEIRSEQDTSLTFEEKLLVGEL